MRTLVSAHISVLALAVSLPAPAQVPVQELTYRGFSVVSQSNLEPSLNRYAASGYRLAALTTAANGNVLVVMEKLPPEAAVREYRVVYGGWAHLRGLHNEPPAADQMNQAGAQGFRFFPGSILFSSGAAAAVVMEKDPDPSARYAYRIYSPQIDTSHRFEQDALRGEAEGFHVVFHGAAGRGPSTLMEKRTDAPAPAAQPSSPNRFLTISSKEIPKRLQQQIADGYIPVRNSVWLDLSSIQNSFWLQKTGNADLRLVTHAMEFSDKQPVTAEFAEEFTRQLNEAAAQGYRLTAPPIRVNYVKPAFLVHWMAGFTGVLQRSPGAAPITYRYVPGMPLPDLISQLNDAALQGFHIVPESLGQDGSILIERVPSAPVSGGAQ